MYMRRNCHVCRAEGFDAHMRVEVWCGGQHILATVNVIDSDLLALSEASLSASAWHALGAAPGDAVTVLHEPTLD